MPSLGLKLCVIGVSIQRGQFSTCWGHLGFLKNMQSCWNGMDIEDVSRTLFLFVSFYSQYQYICIWENHRLSNLIVLLEKRIHILYWEHRVLLASIFNESTSDSIFNVEIWILSLFSTRIKILCHTHTIAPGIVHDYWEHSIWKWNPSDNIYTKNKK
jgi:hypothetical protein